MASGVSSAPTLRGLEACLSGLRARRPGREETLWNVGAPSERLRDFFFCFLDEKNAPEPCAWGLIADGHQKSTGLSKPAWQTIRAKRRFKRDAANFSI